MANLRTDAFVTNKEEAKAALREGMGVMGDRQIGKTEALMEVFHEDYKGNVVVITINQRMGHLFKTRYHQKFPDDTIPKIDCSKEAGRGHTLPMFADCFKFLREDFKAELEERLKAYIY